MAEVNYMSKARDTKNDVIVDVMSDIIIKDYEEQMNEQLQQDEQMACRSNLLELADVEELYRENCS